MHESQTIETVCRRRFFLFVYSPRAKEKKQCAIYFFTQCGIIISTRNFLSLLLLLLVLILKFLPLANSVRCIHFDLFGLRAMYGFDCAVLCLFLSLAVFSFHHFFGDSGGKKKRIFPFFRYTRMVNMYMLRIHPFTIA